MEEFEATVNEPSHDVTKQELSEVKPEVILPPTDPAAVEPTEIPSSGTEIISETNPKPVEDVSVSSKEMCVYPILVSGTQCERHNVI